MITITKRFCDGDGGIIIVFLKEDRGDAYEVFLVWICFRCWLDDCVYFDDLFYLLMIGEDMLRVWEVAAMFWFGSSLYWQSCCYEED